LRRYVRMREGDGSAPGDELSDRWVKSAWPATRGV
jgi:hypothetical protein